MSKIICITGMHRSGTSLTASWLQKCGLPIDNGQLIGAAGGNPKGHFEDKEFVDLHSKVILSLNKGSKGWIEFSKKYRFEERDIQKAGILVDERKEYKLWGWKDPRSVLFLEQWVKLIPNLKFIFLWRPAFEVVDSLIERNKNSINPDFVINRFKAYKTWRHYNNQIIKFYNEYPDQSILINIYNVLESDREFYDQINNKFKLNLEFIPIGTVVDENLLKSKGLNITDRFFYGILGLLRIEKELEKLSFN